MDRRTSKQADQAKRRAAFMKDSPTGAMIRSTSDWSDKNIAETAKQEEGDQQIKHSKHDAEEAVPHLEGFMNQVTDKNVVKQAKRDWSTKTLDEVH